MGTVGSAKKQYVPAATDTAAFAKWFRKEGQCRPLRRKQANRVCGTNSLFGCFMGDGGNGRGKWDNIAQSWYAGC